MKALEWQPRNQKMQRAQEMRIRKKTGEENKRSEITPPLMQLLLRQTWRGKALSRWSVYLPSV